MNVIEMLKNSLWVKWYNWNGRANRKEWWITTIILTIIIEIVEYYVDFDAADLQMSVGVIGLSIALYAVITSFTLTVRRLHDCGYKAAWAIMGFIPIANIFLFYLLGFKAGDKFNNEYGEIPE